MGWALSRSFVAAGGSVECGGITGNYLENYLERVARFGVDFGGGWLDEWGARCDVRVLVSGASGLVGTAVVGALRARGDEVVSLVRRAPKGPGEREWDPAGRSIAAGALEGVDAVVHLAGENIGARRWNDAHKAAVLASRVDGTATLAQAVAALAEPPRVFVSASAVGFYGDTGEARVDEGAPAGTGFLAEVCRAWEAELGPIEAAGVRVVRARLGVVVAKEGGALEKMLLPFRLGVGGRLGDGRQGFPWVALEDVVGAILFAIDRETIAGPMNVVAPESLSNAQMTAALGRVLRRPTFLPVPGFALRIAAGGEMADELMLHGAFVAPGVLAGAGYRFRQERFEDAVRSFVVA